MLMKQYSAKTTTTTLCQWLGLPRSVRYYKPKEGKPGVKPSTHTLKTDGVQVSNTAVIDDIRHLLNQEFVNYGYEKVTVSLCNMQYIINKKKVYRLMDENHLLLGKVIRTSGKRNFVKHRKIDAKYPMEFICLDIKYVWVHGEGRFYFLLTVLDVYSRKALAHLFQKSIRKMDVINLFRKLNLMYGIKGVTVRNDNGSQFIANDVKQFLRTLEAKQEFTHIATPEENAYIEAFHSVVQRDIIERFEFTGYYDAKLTFDAYMEYYNAKYLHRRIGMMTPNQKWELGWASSPLKKQFDKTEYICQDEEQKNESLLLNQFEKSVQLLGG